MCGEWTPPSFFMQRIVNVGVMCILMCAPAILFIAYPGTKVNHVSISGKYPVVGGNILHFFSPDGLISGIQDLP
jgi:hypothetical protein